MAAASAARVCESLVAVASVAAGAAIGRRYLRGNFVCEVECQKSLVAAGGRALDQQLQPPGLGQVDAGGIGHNEQVRLGEIRRAGGRGATQPSVHPVAEAHALIALQQLEPVKDAAADIARSLEGIGAVGEHRDRLLISAQVTLQLREAGIAQQTAADRGDAYRRDVQVDEVLRRVVQFRPCRGVRMAVAGERVGDLAHRQMQPAHRPVGEQCRPVLNRVARRVERARGLGRRLLRGARIEAPRHARGRSHDAVADHHDGDGGAAHDVDRRSRADGRYLAGVAPDIAVDEPDYALRRDADQHDRLMMFDQPGAADAAVGVEAHQNIDRLAGIPHCGDDVGVQEDEADALLTRVGGHNRWRALRRAEPIGARDEVGGGHGGEEFNEPAGLRHGRHGGTEQPCEGQDKQTQQCPVARQMVSVRHSTPPGAQWAALGPSGTSCVAGTGWLSSGHDGGGRINLYR